MQFNYLIIILEMLYQFHEYTKMYGNIMKIQIGPSFIIFITDPLLLEKLLTSTTILDKTPDYHFFDKWLGSGLLLSTGNGHKQKQKVAAN